MYRKSCITFCFSLVIAAAWLALSAIFAGDALAQTGAAQALTIDRAQNGLTVAVWEDHKSPIVTVDVWINTGSLIEGDEHWGLAHFFEHCFYRGTKKRGPRQNRDEIINVGGMTSAGTWYDYTHFYNSVSSEQLDLALDTLTDSLMNLTLPEDGINLERTVINEEIKQRLDDPSLYPWEEMMARIFPESKYGKRVIGTEDSIRYFDRSTVDAYYRAHYSPENTAIVIAGDVNPQAAISLAKSKLAGWTSKSAPAVWPSPANSFAGFSADEETGKYSGAQVNVGWRMPGFKHPDRYALEVAEHLLATGRAARLKNLIGNGILSVYGGYQQYRNAGTFILYVTPDQSTGLSGAAAKVIAGIAEFAKTGPSDAEVADAITQLEMALRFYQAGTRERATLIGNAIVYGNPRYYTEYLNNLSKVTAADVKRVVNSYFVKDNCTILYMRPRPGTAAGGEAELDTALSSLPAAGTVDFTKTLYPDEVKPQKGAGAPAAPGASGMRDATLSDGMKVIIVNQPGSDICSMGVFFAGGSASDPPGKEGLTNLTLGMLEYGSASLKRNEIVNTLAALGDRYGYGVARDYGQVAITTTSDNAQRAIEMLKKMLKRPAFDSAYLEDARNTQLGKLAGESEDIFAVGQDSFRQAAFQGTAYAQPPLGTPGSLAAITIADVSAHWERTAAPRGAVFMFVGDAAKAGLDNPASIGQILYGTGEPFSAPDLPDGAGLRGAYQVNMAREQNLLVLGARTGGAGGNPDYGALMAASALLNLRVFREIVYEKGLAYRSVAEFVPWRKAGLLMLTVGYSPQREADVFAAVSDQIARLAGAPPSDSELAGVKGFVTGYQALSLELPEDKLARFGQWEMAGAGYAFLPQFNAAVKSVTPEQIQTAAQRYFSQDRLLQIVVKG
ncbi:MAG: insulinase family protein [bacterium]